MPHDDEGRDWSDASASQGMPKATDNTTEPEEAKKDSPAGLRGSMELPTL